MFYIIIKNRTFKKNKKNQTNKKGGKSEKNQFEPKGCNNFKSSWIKSLFLNQIFFFFLLFLINFNEIISLSLYIVHLKFGQHTVFL